MTDYLKDYKAYYQLRMLRYEGNPDYPNSYQSEKAIYTALASCTVLEEFKDKLGSLNDKNAAALLIDEYNIRLSHYEEIKEPIKVEGCKRIIQQAATIGNVADLITMINEEENKTSLVITADTINPFPDFGYLERIEIWETADVPDKYKNRYQQYADEEKKNLNNSYTETEKAISIFQPGWKFDFDRIKEERHCRVLPFPDELIDTSIQKIKEIRHAG